jgi:hypothetical protein
VAAKVRPDLVWLPLAPALQSATILAKVIKTSARVTQAKQGSPWLPLAFWLQDSVKSASKAASKVAKQRKSKAALEHHRVPSAKAVPKTRSEKLKKSAEKVETARLRAARKAKDLVERIRLPAIVAARLAAREARARSETNAPQAAAERQAQNHVVINEELLRTSTLHGARNYTLLMVIEPLTLELQDMIDEVYGAEHSELPAHFVGRRWALPARLRAAERFDFYSCVGFLAKTGCVVCVFAAASGVADL